MATGSSVLRSQMAPAFLKVFAATGGDLAALLARFALPSDAATRREIDVTLDGLDAIANAAALQAGDPNLGLHLASRLPRGSYGLLEYIGRSAPTVRHAGERFLRYSALLNELVRFEFVVNGATALLCQRVEGHPPCVGRQAGEMFIALVVRYLREITDSDWAPVQVAFAHQAPIDTSELDAYFRAPLAWERGQNHVELPLALLERSLVSHDEALFSMLDTQAEQLLAARARDEPKEDAKLRTTIRRALEDGNPKIQDVAKTLGLSARTLQRRLGDRGTTFQAEVDAVREDLARTLMKDPKYALGEVAYLLGFSEISAFTRAFKRWTGVTPSRWRDRSK